MWQDSQILYLNWYEQFLQWIIASWCDFLPLMEMRNWQLLQSINVQIAPHSHWCFIPFLKFPVDLFQAWKPPHDPQLMTIRLAAHLRQSISFLLIVGSTIWQTNRLGFRQSRLGHLTTSSFIGTVMGKLQ